MKGFRDFVLRGNVVDLAVAVIVGAAFSAVVSAFATGFIGGLIGAIGGTPDFGKAGFEINGSNVVYGTTINALIYFLIVAVIVYFLVVLPVQKLLSRFKPQQDTDEPNKSCPECLSSIPMGASRCAFCTAVQPDVAA